MSNDVTINISSRRGVCECMVLSPGPCLTVRAFSLEPIYCLTSHVSDFDLLYNASGAAHSCLLPVDGALTRTFLWRYTLCSD